MMILNPQQQAYPPLSSNNPITQAEKNKGKILSTLTIVTGIERLRMAREN